MALFTTYRRPVDRTEPVNRWLILAVISLAQLMLILDTTIVSIALPSLQEDLGMSDSNRQWVITAYTLAFGGFLLLGGRIASLIGYRNGLIIGLLGFAAASALGGAAQSQELLIVARGLQGLFGALIAPTALSLLTTTFTEPNDRAKAFGIFGALGAGGAAVGLILGGLLTEYLNWRWTFYVNLPLAALAIFGAVRNLHNYARSENRVQLDVPGAILGTAGLVSLVFGFNRAEVLGWGSTTTIAWLTGSIVLLASFIFWQARAPHPLLPLRILRDRTRSGAFMAAAMVTFALFGMFFFLTYYLQVVQGMSPVRTGLAFVPQTAAIIFGSQISIRLMNRVSPRVPIGAGAGLLVVALLMLSTLETSSSYVGLVLPVLLISGVGAALIFITSMNSATAGIEARDAGTASALVNTSQQIGASIGTSLLSTLAASAATAYVRSHPGQTTGSVDAMVHGFGSAVVWAAMIVLVVGTTAVIQMRGRAPQPTEQDAPVFVHAG